ncbi:tyrosine-type recombinase/integrase [Streptomyces sp. SID486]|nr:tyrosine-type recombinase/integrase [Streptomyces sp. SID486]
MLPRGALSPDARLHPFRAQVRPGARRPRGRDPAQRRPQRPPGTPRPRRFEPLTADEARQFLAATRGHRLHALFELAPHTGLRKGELLGLTREDLNLDAGTAAISRTLQGAAAGGLITLLTRPGPPSAVSPFPAVASTR